MHWRLLLTPALSGAENMALDDALLERARSSGEAVFRVYAWAAPTLSFGRNQTALGIYQAEQAAERGIAIVRRPTGGRALLHHREITYSVTAPLALGSSLRESYGRINRLLVTGLRELGVEVEIAAPSERQSAPSASPCFERPSSGELVLDGRKLVGSAQWRDGGAMLQHGSILIEDEQHIVAELGDMLAPPPAATLAEALGHDPGLDTVATALFGAVRTIECADAEPLDVDPPLARDARAALDRYTDARWTWRR